MSNTNNFRAVRIIKNEGDKFPEFIVVSRPDSGGETPDTYDFYLNPQTGEVTDYGAVNCWGDYNPDAPIPDEVWEIVERC